MVIVETIPVIWDPLERNRSDVAEIVASGETALDCLTNLVEALNEEAIDTDNNFLEVTEDFTP